LCFVQTGQYDKFIEERASGRIRPGRVVRDQGQLLGQHSGLHLFTLGQRKNLGVATGQRSYVIALDPTSADVTLGEKSELLRDWARLENVQIAADLDLPSQVECMVRYRGRRQGANLFEKDGIFQVHFEQPVAPIVPGQYAVFFKGDRVVGGGKIATTGRNAPPEVARLECS
jgi:tRNA-specific 2-thiouridylase